MPFPFPTRGLQVQNWVDKDPASGDSPVESFDMETATATRVIQTSWLNRGIATYQLLGYPVWDDSDPENPLINRYLPDFHPDFPWMVPVKISSIKGLGARGYIIANGGKVANYERAALTVQYEFPNYDLLWDYETASEFDRYRTFEAKPASEYLSIPQTGGSPYLKWAQGPRVCTPFPGNVGFILGTIDFHWKWLQVPFQALPFYAFTHTVGCVNDAEFADCEPGTLLLIGVDYARKNSPFGLRTWTIEYTARYNERGHNNFYDFLGSSQGSGSGGAGSGCGNCATGSGTAGTSGRGWYQATTNGCYYPPSSWESYRNLDGTSELDGLMLYNPRNYEDLFTPPPVPS